jgi:hypothetical protein
MFNIENNRKPPQNLVYASEEALEKQNLRGSYAAFQQQLYKHYYNRV